MKLLICTACLLRMPEEGQMSNGWGEVSHWPTERIGRAGDWAPAIWRSPEAGPSRHQIYANHVGLLTDSIAE